ncbi:MAG: hypothetical protein JRI45_02810 [Deltaproteobacteria bacterium]|nr:hypothetical protein [Deltaproteobacteria bacterium]MBW2068140.1 hypothetical protein [Deltaproteobacteria bacterium]
MTQDRFVETIKGMAKEYLEKLKALEEQTKDMTPDRFWRTVRIHGERTLDGFRSVQQSCLRSIFLDKEKIPEDLREGFQSLCRYFDEMQALFWVTSDRYFSDVVEQKEATKKLQGDNHEG